MNYLKQLFRPPSATAPLPPLPEDFDTFEVLNIVGESFYQDALARHAGPRGREAKSHRVIVRIELEPTNPVDPMAVCVSIEGQLVGHLSRTDARRWHRQKLTSLYAEARIVGGWYRNREDQGSYGLLVFLPPETAALMHPYRRAPKA